MSYNLTQAPTTPQAGQSQSAWIADAAKNGWSDPQALLQNIYKYSGTIGGTPTEDDPTFQKLVSQGYLTPNTDANSGSVSYSGNNLPQSANGWAPGLFQGGGGPSQVFGGGTDTKTIDPSQVAKDPLYGAVTGNANIYTPTDTFDRVAPMIPMLIAGLASGGAGFAGMGALGGDTAGMGLAQTAQGVLSAGENAANGGGFNPMALASLVQFIPGLSQIAPYLNAARGVYSMTQGNPMGALGTLGALARFGGQGTGGP